jgi:elongation factor P hydroxylase
VTKHCDQDLIHLFNHLFEQAEETILVGGAEEPLYLPKNESCSKNQIIYKLDYYSSALHEIAHWCIASKERRKLPDYGYWYEPQRELSADQQLFEQVEAKPQALEWIFSMAAGIQFYISADNLSRNNEASSSFKSSIYEHVLRYLSVGLPVRAQKFTEQLLSCYKRHELFSSSCFLLEDL